MATDPSAAGRASADKRQRVFFALWPDEDIRRRLLAMLQQAQAIVGGRATAAANLHLTLAFIGDVDSQLRDRLIAIGDRLDTLASPAGRLRIEYVDWWRHNRIVWCGGTADTDWWQLARQLRDRVTDAGHTLDRTRFVPHVTLLRKARRAPRLPGPEPFSWPATDLRLVASEPQPEGVRYRTIASWRAEP